MKQTLPIALALLASCASTASRPQDPTDGDLDRARQLIRAERFHEALDLIDAVRRRDNGNRQAHLLAARANAALFRSGASGAQYLLADAIRDYERALDLDAGDPDSWLELSGLLLADARFADGKDAARQALERFRAARAPDGKIAAALLAIADNDLQVFVDARRPEIEAGADPAERTVALANATLATLNAAVQAGAASAASLKSATVYQWLGRELDALDILERAIDANPGDNELHNRFQAIYGNAGRAVECVAAYHRLAAAHPDNPTLSWFLGRAVFAAADAARRDGEFGTAKARYEEARDVYTAYDRARPNHRETTAQWLALCELSLARVAFEQGRTDDAKAHLLAAWDHTPLVGEYDDSGYPRVYDSFGGNYVGGLFLVGSAITERDGLAASLAYYREIIERHERLDGLPGRFGTIYNNAALSARDLGSQVAGRDGDGDPDEARRLWEQSYHYYCKAVELEPEDPRIVNDCGLMLIYHLHRDLDRARGLFDRAIEIGLPQLAALPDDADEQVRNDLEEAIGDAYQNIGVLLTQQDAPAEEIRPFLEKAILYYPYRRRQAAAMLRRLDGEPEAQDPDRDPRRPAFDAAVREAETAAQAGDYDRALLVLDEVKATMRGYAPFHYRVGLYSLRYAERAAANGGGAGQVDGLYADALAELQRAVELDGEQVAPRIELARVRLATGDSAGAQAEADGVLSHLRSIGSDGAVEAHAIRAEAAARVFIGKKGEGETDEEALRQARTSFRELESGGRLDTAARTTWATLEEWAGSGEQAVAIYVRALGRQADDADALGRLVDVAGRTAQADKAVDALARRTDGLGLWYLGRARHDLARQQWAGGDAVQGAATLAAAREAFARAGEQNPDYRASSEHWSVLCLGSEALMWLSTKDYTKAETALLDGLRRRPDLLEADLGGGETIKRGILLVGDRYYREQDDLGKAEALYRKACELVPGDVDLANNHGLFARDHGTELERDGKTELAREMYEHSYAAYTRAAELDPQNVRLRNDRALLLIYHLQRDLDLARTLLEQAIADGDAMLRDAPPADRAERRSLEEAVGDCYQNLGVYHLDSTRDLAAARRYLEKSLDYYPGEERASTSHLRRLERQEAGDGKSGDGKGDGGKGDGGK